MIFFGYSKKQSCVGFVIDVCWKMGREHPLILYLYAKSKKTIEKVLRNTSSGMVLVNDVLIHSTGELVTIC